MIIIVLSCFSIGGCVTTDMTGFKDPDYNKFAPDSIVVYVPEPDLKFASRLEKSIADEFASRKVKAYRFIDLFPPTRDRNGDVVAEVLSNRNIQCLLIVELVADKSSSDVVAVSSFGNSTYNSFYGRTYGYGSNIAVPIRNDQRTLSSKLVFIDVDTGRAAWVGNADTEAKGGRYAKDRSVMLNLSREIVKHFQNNGMISPFSR